MSGSCPSTCPPPHTRCRAHWVTAAQHVVREERANTVQEQECKKPPVRDTCQQLLLLESYSVCSIKLYHQVPARAGKGRGKEGEFSVCGRHGSGGKQTGQCLASSELAKPTKWVLGSCLSQRLPAIKQAYCSLAESPSILAGGRRQDSKEGTEQHLRLLSGGGRGGRPGTHVTRAVDCRLHQEQAGLEEPLL